MVTAVNKLPDICVVFSNKFVLHASCKVFIMSRPVTEAIFVLDCFKNIQSINQYNLIFKVFASIFYNNFLLKRPNLVLVAHDCNSAIGGL